MTTFNIKQASSKAVEFSSDRFDYASDWRIGLTLLAGKLANSRAEAESAFDGICHIAYAQATQRKTKKDVHTAVAEVRDEIEEALGKRYARAFALAVQELAFELPEQAVFEAVNFSAYIDAKSPRTKKEAEHGIAAMLKTFRNKVEKLQKTENPQPWVKEEIDAYALIIKTLEDSVSK